MARPISSVALSGIEPAQVDLLRGMPARHKVLFGSEPDDAGWDASGIALAYDGMEIQL